MEERLLNVNDSTLPARSEARSHQKIMRFTRVKKTKWKKKKDARKFLTDVQNTLTRDSQEAKELRKQFFPNRSLGDSVAKANLLMPAAVAVPAIGDVS